MAPRTSRNETSFQSETISTNNVGSTVLYVQRCSVFPRKVACEQTPSTRNGIVACKVSPFADLFRGVRTTRLPRSLGTRDCLAPGRSQLITGVGAHRNGRLFSIISDNGSNEMFLKAYSQYSLHFEEKMEAFFITIVP